MDVGEDYELLRNVDVVVSASNSATPILLPEHFASDRPVLVCDIAVPADVSPRVSRERPNVRVILGGLVRLPCDPEFELPGLPLPKGQTFACAAETMLLGLSGVGKDFSRGALTTAQVRESLALARLHGFALGSAKDVRSY